MRMMNNYNRVCAEIDLDAIEHNLTSMHRRLPADTMMMGIIKADGYGHGCERIGSMLEGLDFIWGYGVATADEALELKNVPLKKPVLVLGCVFPDQYESMIREEVRINVYTCEMAEQIADCARALGKQAYVHIKLDTGMNRIGFACTETSVDEIIKITEMNELICEGLFTHFSKADEPDKTYTNDQISRFETMISALRERGVCFKLTHAANSAGIIDFAELTYPLVRAGIALYGLCPSQDVDLKSVSLQPALALKSHVIMVKTVEAGSRISYGGDFTAPDVMRIATIPVGYGDGYPRSLSGKGSVLIHGKRAPILGRICMDQFMVDVTGIPETVFGDQVTLIGTDGDEMITVEELADLSGRFNYEFVCDLNKRIPRVYYHEGDVVGSLDFFESEQS